MTFLRIHHTPLADVAPPPETLITEAPLIGIVGGCLLTIAAVWAVITIGRRIKPRAGDSPGNLDVE